MKFRATLESAGKTAAGFEFPPDIVEALGAGKRPPIRLTVNGHTYRTTVAVMGGRFMVGMSVEERRQAGVSAGDVLDLDVELDTQPREVTVPADFAAALEAEPGAARFFDGLSYSNRRWHVASIEGTKNPETRQRRIAKSIDMLRERKLPG